MGDGLEGREAGARVQVGEAGVEVNRGMRQRKSGARRTGPGTQGYRGRGGRR